MGIFMSTRLVDGALKVDLRTTVDQLDISRCSRSYMAYAAFILLFYYI